MPILAGEKVTAAKLNRLKTTTYEAAATGDVTASTAADVPGCSVTLTTETNGAIFVAHGSADFNPTGIPGGDSQLQCHVDGVAESAIAIYRSGTATDRVSQSKVWRGTLATAGSHTIKLHGITAANVVIEDVHTVLVVEIHEVV